MLRGGLVPAVAAALSAAASAQELPHAPAAGAEVFVSTDSDKTTVLRTAIDFDLRNKGPERRLGIRLEKAWYDPVDSGTRERERVFLQAADVTGGWNWSARVGTDGKSVIGAASAHDSARIRKEFFIERDIVETRQGLDRSIYSTFLGAAVDLPASERTVFTVLAGVQEFTGENVRFHLRGNAVHVVDQEIGLSAQLRGRYFRSTQPGEFDYYSPRWYAQILPVAQIRRFVGGWELLGAGGIGLQRDSSSDWRRSDYAHVSVRSPQNSQNWSIQGGLTFTNAPSDSAALDGSYRYFQTSLSVLKRF
jgi:hypothetical protein